MMTADQGNNFMFYNGLQLPEGRDLENEIINLKTKLC